jgi:hypothetical protein
VPENEVAWLFKIAHNVCATSKLAWLRRRRVEAPRDLDTLPVEPASPESRRDELAGLEDALASMPPRLREAFLLREWQGLSYAEIAERLDTSHSAVETLIFRARKHLAQQLEQPLKRVREALGLGPLLNLARGLFEGAPAAVKAAGVIALAVGGTVAAKPLVGSDRSGPVVPPNARTAPAPARPAPVTQSRPGPQRAARQRTAVLTTPQSTPVSSQPRVPLAPSAPPQNPTTPVPSVASPSSPASKPASTTPLVPALGVPALGAPPLPPTLTTPSVTTPSVTTPALPVATPSVPITPPPSSPALPSVTTPDLPSAPSVKAPTVPVPSVPVPSVPAPSVTVPGQLP